MRPTLRFDLQNTKAADPSARIVRAMAAQAVVGMIPLRRVAGDVHLVEELMVSADCRGTGVGAALVATAAETILKQRGRRLIVECGDDGSGRLTRWYARLGFVMKGVSPAGRALLVGDVWTVQSRALRGLELIRRQAARGGRWPCRRGPGPGVSYEDAVSLRG